MQVQKQAGTTSLGQLPKREEYEEREACKVHKPGESSTVLVYSKKNCGFYCLSFLLPSLHNIFPLYHAFLLDFQCFSSHNLLTLVISMAFSSYDVTSGF